MRDLRREGLKPIPAIEVETGDLIDSYPVLIRVAGEWFEANAVPDISDEGMPFIRFEQIQMPANDVETESFEDDEALQAANVTLGEDTHPTKPEAEDAIGALTVSSLSGGEGVVDAQGSRLKTIKYEPHQTTIIPTVRKFPDGKQLPAMRVEELEELAESDDN